MASYKPIGLKAGSPTELGAAELDGDVLPALSTAKKGGVPATGAPSGKYLKDDGNWSMPTYADVGAAAAGDLTNHINATGTNVHGLGTLSTHALGDVHTSNGFANLADSVLQINGANFEVAVAGGKSSFVIYSNGTPITKTTAQQVALSAFTDNALNYVYFNSAGAIQTATSPWAIVSDAIPAAIIHKSGSVYRVNDERHLAGRNLNWHQWAHETIGARYESGANLTYPTVATPGQLSISALVMHDEDIENPNQNAQTKCWIMYRTSTGLSMKFNSSESATPYVLNGANIQYDNGSGTLVDATNNHYMSYWLYGTMSTVATGTNLVLVVGQSTHATLAAEQAATLPTIPLSTAEWKLLYRFIYRNTGATPSFIQADDYRSVSSGPASAGASAQISASNVLTTTTPFTNILSAANTTVQSALETLDAATVSTNTASSLVKRDSSGNFAAGTITANLTGTASGNLANAALSDTTRVAGWATTDSTVTPTRGQIEAALQDCAVRLADRASAYTATNNYQIPIFYQSGGGIDSYTKICCHFNTDYSDSSANNRTPSAVGSISIDTTYKVFGAGAFSAAAGNYVSYPASVDFSPEAADFCIEFRFRPASVDAHLNFANTVAGGTNGGWQLWAQYQGSPGIYKLSLYDYNASQVGVFQVYSPNVTLVAGAWHALAVTRTSGTTYIFLNGVNQTPVAYSGGSGSWTFYTSVNPLYIGSMGGPAMKIDEFRFSKGAYRYNATYTPATEEFSTPTPAYILGATKTTDLALLAGATFTGDVSFSNAANRTFSVLASATDVAGKSLQVSSGNTVAGTSTDNVAGGELILASGKGTGTGASTISFQTATTLTTGKTLQTLSTKMTITGAGNVGINCTPSYTLDATSAAGIYRLACSTNATNSVLKLETKDSDGTTRIGYLEFQPATGTNQSYMAISNQAGAQNFIVRNDGNVGIGYAPSAWSTLFKALEFSTGTYQGSFNCQTNSATPSMAANWYFSDTAPTQRYYADGYATRYIQYNGTHIFQTAPNNTGGANASCTMTSRMTIDSTGNVGIGTISPTGKIDIAWGGYSSSVPNASALRIGADIGDYISRTNATGKFATISFPHYTNAEQDTIGLMYYGISNTNVQLYIGGGQANYNCATQLNFYTAGDGTTTTGTNRMIIDSAGNVGVGTAAPEYLFQVNKANSAYSTGVSHIAAMTTDSQAADKGGMIMMGGKYTDTLYTVFGGVAARKENSTSSEYGGYLALYCNKQGTGIIEGMRITSAGNVGIGCTPITKLELAGAASAVTATGQVYVRDSVSVIAASNNTVKDNGGHLSLGGNYHSNGTNAVFGAIAGRKENVSNGNYAGYLALSTNEHGTGMVERMRISSVGLVTINEYTQLGSAAPSIKMKKLTGTTNANLGGVVSVVHGLTGAKIISWTCKVEYAANSGVPPSYSSATWNYDCSHDSTYFSITNGAGATAIQSKSFIITVFYEA